jgi:hypothetical protein
MMSSPLWSDLTRIFRFIRASDLLERRALPRHQDWPAQVGWFDDAEPPLVALFISHRWETAAAPDPSGRQLRALQIFLARVGAAAAAAHLARDAREAVLPPLELEGSLQALAVAGRALGFEPLQTAFVPDEVRRRETRTKAAELGPSTSEFQGWVLRRIAVWIDYTCVPQEPRSEADEREFVETLRHLPELAAACVLVALRQPADGYADSGWCAVESYLAGRDATGRGFARNVFVDALGLLESRPLYLPAPPTAPNDEAVRILRDGYEQSRRAFEENLRRTRDSDAPFVTASPPRLWSTYCDLLVGGFHTAEVDPNPIRRGLQLTLSLGESLLAEWMRATAPVECELRALVERQFGAAGLRCTLPLDAVYLGLLLGRRGKLRLFDEVLGDALTRWLGSSDRGSETLRVRLQPPSSAAREIFARLDNPSPSHWHSLLTSGANRPAERQLTAALETELRNQSLRYEFVMVR